MGGPWFWVRFHRAFISRRGYRSKPLRSLDPLEVRSRAGKGEEFSDVSTVGTLQRSAVGRSQFVSVDIGSGSPAERFSTERHDHLVGGDPAVAVWERMDGDGSALAEP